MTKPQWQKVKLNILLNTAHNKLTKVKQTVSPPLQRIKMSQFTN